MNDLLDFVVPRVTEAMKEFLEKDYVVEEVKLKWHYRRLLDLNGLSLVFTSNIQIF